MLRKEQIEYALHYAEGPVEWVFELVRGLEKQIDKLSKFGTNVTVFQEHWHPTSELPPVGENGNSTDVIAIDEDNEPIKVSYSKFYNCWVMADVTAESFDKITIKWWYYPPKED